MSIKHGFKESLKHTTCYANQGMLIDNNVNQNELSMKGLEQNTIVDNATNVN